MTARFLTAALALAAAGLAQQPDTVAYPERDLLSPFRNPQEVYAPPDEAFRLLRTMQALADSPNTAKSFDASGREIVDDPRWHQARGDLLRAGLDAGYLAQIMRLNRNTADRATAFYAAFLVPDVGHVLELITHIPGEPDRRTRERAFPRAVEFLRANLRHSFGDLDDAQRAALVKGLPTPGSPVARATGLTRAPIDSDFLYELTLVPFLQMLDLAEPIDQAQALWFLRQLFTIRGDLAVHWLEPSLPRIRQLLLADDERVRTEAIGLLQTIGPKGLREPPAEDAALLAWADEAARALFPPIRNLNDTIVQLHPSPERDTIADAGIAVLERSAIGDPATGRRRDGSHYRGFRVLTVPAELRPLAIPTDAVITAVNGVAIGDAKGLLQTVRDELEKQQRGRNARKLVVEYVLGGESRAVEYRVM